ncbi:MAG TPA: glycosyltransferase family 2 protein [Candidatus Limnocylindria bacterium]|nr:glycosyltransferase family 2 protein [Candidatus Limnocylindria bacterium]
MNAASRSPLISIVIPLYNEGSHVSALLSDLKAALQQIECSFEVILVDDGSPDDMWRKIKDEARTFPSLRAIRLSRNFGKELALCAGLERAGGDAVIVMDGDGQHPPSLVPVMVEKWQSSGADIVQGVKVRRGRESLTSKLGALSFYVILNKLSGFELKGASDFKLMDRKVADTWLKMRERNVFFRGMTAWMGFNTVQIQFEVVPRREGRSGWSYFKRWKLALIGITTFSSFPLHLVTFAGLIFLLFALGLGIQTLYLKLAGRALTGFATVILLELIIGSLLMISLGIIGEYLARIYEEVKGRPRYIITESIEPDSGQGISPEESLRTTSSTNRARLRRGRAARDEGAESV